MRAVIADTGPLYAAFDPSDQYHSQAQAELQRLAQENLAVVVSYPVALEAYTLVIQRLGPQPGINFLRDLLEGAEFINPTTDDYQAAFQRVLQYPDQRITLFDATTAVIAQRLVCPVWTYDYHFDIMQTQVWR